MLSLKRQVMHQKLYPLIVWDSLTIILTLSLAVAFRFEGDVPFSEVIFLCYAIPPVILLYCSVNIFFGLYAHLWRYENANAVFTIVTSVATSTIILFMVALLGNLRLNLPLGVVLLNGLLSIETFTAVRYRQRLLTGILRRLHKAVMHPEHRVLIIGAGEAGHILARQFETFSQQYRYQLVGFVDDNPQKLNLKVQGGRVLGNRWDIPKLVMEYQVSLIIVAIHKLPGPVLRDVLSICLATDAQIKILPNFLGEMDNLNDTLPIKDITPEDLLGRPTQSVNQAACREIINGKVVLVTGAAGSIGSELCQQICQLHPRQLLLLDNNETGLYDLAMMLRSKAANCAESLSDNRLPLTSIIADVTHQAKLETIFATYHPQVIFHAAAYKHVPLMEEHPDEAVRVNVSGTKNLVELATRYSAERFVFISSDKAINPSSIMGATKRLGEMMLMDGGLPIDNNGNGYHFTNGYSATNGNGYQTNGHSTTNGNGHQTNGHSASNGNGHQTDGNGTAKPSNGQLKITKPSTLFAAVRFGNVLGSRGSVVPTFTRQIDEGGPITITHPDMNRYFMSIAEAVSLVIQAATLTKGGDIFMLDMGQELRITDLAHKMIRLRGLRPGVDIQIVYTGLRPGEKFHEELLAPTEERESTSHPSIFRIQSRQWVGKATLTNQVPRLLELANLQRKEEMTALLWHLVKTKSNEVFLTEQNITMPKVVNEMSYCN